jgi:DNA polymerase V
MTLPPGLRWIESWLDEPTLLLPDVPDVEQALAALAPIAVAARAELAPADPAEVILFMKTFADRHRLDLPDIYALELDSETLAEVPRVALKEAFKKIWKTWKYRRLPTVGDILAIAERELQDGRAGLLRRLSAIELKLQTARMRARWDAEAHERHARNLAAERRRSASAPAGPAEPVADAAPKDLVPGDRDYRQRVHREAFRHVAKTLAERRRLLAERERPTAEEDLAPTDNQAVAAGSMPTGNTTLFMTSDPCGRPNSGRFHQGLAASVCSAGLPNTLIVHRIARFSCHPAQTMPKAGIRNGSQIRKRKRSRLRGQGKRNVLLMNAILGRSFVSTSAVLTGPWRVAGMVEPMPIHVPPCLVCSVAGIVPAGFPSPAADYEVGRFDLKRIFVPHPSATSTVQIAGHSRTREQSRWRFGADGPLLDGAPRRRGDRYGGRRIDVQAAHPSRQPDLVGAGFERSGLPVVDIIGRLDFEVWGIVTTGTSTRGPVRPRKKDMLRKGADRTREHSGTECAADVLRAEAGATPHRPLLRPDPPQVKPSSRCDRNRRPRAALEKTCLPAAMDLPDANMSLRRKRASGSRARIQSGRLVPLTTCDTVCRSVRKPAGSIRLTGPF